MSCSSVFTSGTILILAGYIVYMISSTAAIGGLGHRSEEVHCLACVWYLPFCRHC